MSEREGGGRVPGDERAVDFSALGEPVRADRMDAMVAATMRRAVGELERRRGVVGVVRVVVAWRRPVLMLAGLAAAAAMVLIVERPASVAQSAAGTASAASAPATVAEAIGIPAAYAELVEGRAR